eukprot:TRINITY_DN10680_c0_g2_i1.p1 TRINITY_DN10680_c0_g2~~TRINITY_DN10680_c0_g2_i1.p1  ORF type:complete len:671 (+),score=238.71 TRINITY_DN10680_c0_g2_i1:63-2075(+)
MFRKSSAGKKFRKRAQADDDEEEVAPAAAPLKKPPAAASTLSFDEEPADEGADFVIRKKKKKRGLHEHSTKKDAPLPASSVNTQVSAAGAYSAENIKALAKNATYSGNTPKLHQAALFDDVPTLKVTHGSATEAPKGAGQEQEQEQEGGRGGAIPSDEMIRFAKEKREKLRLGGGGPAASGDGYIPLSAEASGEPEGESRLVRDDIEDDTDEHFADAEGQVLAFGDPKEAEKKARRAEVMGALNSVEGDQESFEWEMAQIRKGTGAAGDEMSSVSKLRAQRGGMHDNTQGGDTELKHVTVELIQGELREALLAMQNKHEQDRAELERTVSRHDSAQCELESSEHGNGAASKRYQLFQKMQEYVLDLLDCFEAKLTDIEASEDQVRELRKGRQQALEARQQSTTQDMRQLAALASNTAPADTARAADVQRRADDRAEARQARENDEALGLSSDEEEAGAGALFAAQCESSRAALEEAFEEVSEEMKQLPALKHSFGGWKEQEAASYKAGFVASSLPALFGPLVRRELLTWMPLSQPELTGMPWFTVLQDYGMSTQEHPMDPNDQDYHLIPKLVANTALPIACDAVEFDWDPVSRRSTKQVVRLWHELTDFLDPSDSQMSELLQILTDRLHAAVKQAWLPVVSPSASPAMHCITDKLFMLSLIHISEPTRPY